MGHRGARNIAPENTLLAFQKAIELKANYIEFDVFKSKDGEIVVTHDPELSRLTGHSGFVEDLTLKELKTLDFGEGEKIPTLLDVIYLTKGKIGLCVEVLSTNIGKKLVQLLRESDLVKNTIISSFNFKELKKIQKLEPNFKFASLIPYGHADNNPKWINWKIKKKAIDRAAKNDFSFIHPHYVIVNKQLIDYSHRQNLKVTVFTVDVKPAMKKLIRYGVDGIITNDIIAAKEVINNIK
ncbi:MAG: glycerophosphodiester phosphodiesterase [Promethearchaeota archaeon]